MCELGHHNACAEVRGQFVESTSLSLYVGPLGLKHKSLGLCGNTFVPTWPSHQLRCLVLCDQFLLFGKVFPRFIQIIYITTACRILAKHHPTIKFYFLFACSSVDRELDCVYFELL